MLTVKGLVKSYGQESVLKDFTAAFQDNAINVIIGPSGCGKTTLFSCISGLEPFEAGTVLLGDQLILSPGGKKNEDVIQIGYVLQGFSLFSHLSVLDNLTIAPRLVRREGKRDCEMRAKALLDKMQLKNKYTAYPSELSGGEQQRVAIARSIMMNPQVLLLDEPTTALDPQLILSLETILKSLVADGLTLIVSTHHLGFAKRIADTCYFLFNGEILEKSPGAELLTHPQHLAIQQFIQEEEAHHAFG